MRRLLECDHLLGRQRQICCGEANLPRETVNKYRALWGLPPLPGHVPVTIVERASGSGLQTTGAKPPGLLKRALTFAKALTKHAADRGRKRSKAEVKQIVVICEACPFYDASREQCLRCGCNCSGKNEFLNKLTWRSESCPDGRW